MAFAGSARAALSLNAVGLACGASGSSRDLSSVASATVPVHRLSSSHAHGIQLPVIKSIGAAPDHHASTCTVQATVAAAPAGSKAAAQDEGRVYNFAAGPACLPYNVLKEAQADLINWKGTGTSVMEMSHRSKEFLSIIQKAEADLRELLAIPDNYKVLFLQGGATSQFSALPLNLAGPEDTVDYIVTGSWGSKAIQEAGKYAKANLAATGKPGKFTDIPPKSEWKLTNGAKYVHICANETIQGVEFKEYPELEGETVLIADMSSNFCSKPVDVSKFGVIYAGAQKNIGPAGVTIVIVREDLLGKAQPSTPVMLDYKIHNDNASLYNTPPCFSIYMAGLVFADLLQQGGLAAVEKKNEEKAKVLYDAIEGSNGFFKCPVAKPVRSLMNVPFTMADPELEAAFLKTATAAGLIQLKGHRSVGGVRASIYNAMPLAGIQKLVELMKDFQAKHS
jgi:phosphoserine aminotransferase